MDFETWEVDLAAAKARHVSGCVICIEGNPQNPSAVEPSHFPKDLSFADQARLLRCGMDAIAKAANSGGYVVGRGGPEAGQEKGQKRQEKSQKALELEQQAKAFADNPNRPKRAKLSLKAKSPAAGESETAE